jgi:hypothetical protein
VVSRLLREITTLTPSLMLSPSQTDDELYGDYNIVTAASTEAIEVAAIASIHKDVLAPHHFLYESATCKGG